MLSKNDFAIEQISRVKLGTNEVLARHSTKHRKIQSQHEALFSQVLQHAVSPKLEHFNAKSSF